MKKNYVAKLGALALAVSLITTGMMGTTLARYADEVKAEGTVAIAKWNVELGTTQSQDFTLADTKLAFNDGNVGSGVVAPGDQGVVDLEIKDTGTNVAYEYRVKIDSANLSGGHVNIQFYSDSTYTTPWSDAAQKVELPSGSNMTPAKTIPIKLYWKWVEDNSSAGNANDVLAGTTNTNALTFTVTLSAEQIIDESTAAPIS